MQGAACDIGIGNDLLIATELTIINFEHIQKMMMAFKFVKVMFEKWPVILLSIPCFYQVIETQVEVWENKKWASVSTAFFEFSQTFLSQL